MNASGVSIFLDFFCGASVGVVSDLSQRQREGSDEEGVPSSLSCAGACVCACVCASN